MGFRVLGIGFRVRITVVVCGRSRSTFGTLATALAFVDAALPATTGSHAVK